MTQQFELRWDGEPAATPEQVWNAVSVRTDDALYRFYGRDAWGRPVGLAHHLFADGADGEAAGRAWQTWLDDIHTTEES